MNEHILNIPHDFCKTHDVYDLYDSIMIICDGIQKTEVLLHQT